MSIDDDGIPRTIQRRVKVHMIAERHFILGESVANITAHYEITLADVYAALTYYGALVTSPSITFRVAWSFLSHVIDIRDPKITGNVPTSARTIKL